MSRQPSPSPAPTMYAPHHQQHPAAHHGHHGTQLAPSTSASSALAKQRSQTKGYTPGITAGAEDSKYQAKHKELKKKVKEIELDNDKLYLKLLLAKKNIRRMNLERAILYERLAAVPPTPGRQTQDLPPEMDPLFNQQQPQSSQPDVPPSEATDIAINDYLRAHPEARVIQGHHGRPVAIEENPNAEIRTAPGVPPPPPPPGVPIVHSFRHDSAPGIDAHYSQPAPPPPPVVSSGAIRDHYDEPSMATARPLPPPPPQQLGMVERTSSGPAGWGPQEHHHQEIHREHREHHHHRSHSSTSSGHRHHRHHSRDLDTLQGEREQRDIRDVEYDRDYQHGGGHETMRPVRRSSISSHHEIPPPPPDPRSSTNSGGRRHDLHEITHAHDTRHGHPHQHIQIATANLPPSSPPHSPTSGRGRQHNHQRIGPGAHIHREPPRDPEYEMEIQRGRELERIREREREEHMRYQMAREEEEMKLWSEQHGLVGPGMGQAHAGPAPVGAHGRSRSDTPGSASGHDNTTSSRPPSGQSYERGDRSDSRGTRYAPAGTVHHSNLLGFEQEQAAYGDQTYARDVRDRHMRHSSGHIHPHSHAHAYAPAETSGGGGGGRKRPYSDMEVDDSERGGGSGSGSVSGSLRSPLENHPGGAASLGDSMDHHRSAKRRRSPMLSRVREDSMDEDD